MEGYKNAVEDHHFKKVHGEELVCGDDNNEKALSGKSRPDGIIACVEKFTPGNYVACSDLKLSNPGDEKVIHFTSLSTVAIPDPPLTTVIQPAFEIKKRPHQSYSKGY